MGYTTDWKPVRESGFKCLQCHSGEIEGREWESSDGAHDDYHYRCMKCGHSWWVEGADY